jgi:hypothetical protein
MVAYEFYADDGSKGPDLIGILPERRKESTRITEESVTNWGRLLADSVDPNSIYFIRVEI